MMETCPISLGPISAPVRFNEHTYEAAGLKRWMEQYEAAARIKVPPGGRRKKTFSMPTPPPQS